MRKRPSSSVTALARGVPGCVRQVLGRSQVNNSTSWPTAGTRPRLPIEPVGPGRRKRPWKLRSAVGVDDGVTVGVRVDAGGAVDVGRDVDVTVVGGGAV